MQKLSLEIRETIEFIRRLYNTRDFIPLHAPVFQGKEKEYVNQAIDSTFVSSVGAFVDQAEKLTAEAADARYAVAVVNGTAALQIALQIVGVKPGDEVITQALSFVATSNAIHYNQAEPVFLDVSESTMGLCPQALRTFLEDHCTKTTKGPINKTTGARVAACVPMHTFGFAADIGEITAICSDWHLPLVEDAAESFGSSVNSKMLGTFGKAGIVSFNGNKIITAGGGGMLITDNEELAKRAKHLTTTAKQAHPFEYFHNEVGYNFRMPNLNAALLCAQIEQLPEYLAVKRNLAKQYSDYFSTTSIVFREESPNTKSNYWLNSIQLKNREERDKFLKETNEAGVMTRPIWQLLSELPMYKHCQNDNLPRSRHFVDTIINLPSSVSEMHLAKHRHETSSGGAS